MKLNRRITAQLGSIFLILSVFCIANATATSYHAIICGTGGDEQFEKRFNDWGDRLRTVLTTRLYIAEDRVALLKSEVTIEKVEVEVGDGLDAAVADSSLEQLAYTPTNRESIRSLFADYAGQLTEDDNLFLYFIGHGSYIKRESKFNIAGPDLTATELNDLFDQLPARRIVVVNAMSRGAGFVNVLSGDNRVICTATKSVEESNAPEFMEYFIQGLEDGSADQDRDDRISILEACQQASALTQGWYLTEGFVPTEHALIDDNGDKRGSRLPLGIAFEETEVRSGSLPEVPLDGALATKSFLKDYVFPANATPEQIARYVEALDEVATLKKRKAAMAVEEYYQMLEALLVEAATANRLIREETTSSDLSISMQASIT